jgi:succinyl-CoA synthetase beta subunit
MLQLDEYFALNRTENSIALMFERNGGLDALEEVQKHPNKLIYDQSVKILTSYF